MAYYMELSTITNVYNARVHALYTLYISTKIILHSPCYSTDKSLAGIANVWCSRVLDRACIPYSKCVVDRLIASCSYLMAVDIVCWYFEIGQESGKICSKFVSKNLTDNNGQNIS